MGIARALARDPDVIIANEPTGNPDRETRTRIMDILVDLDHNDDKCVIVVPHSKSVAKRTDELWNLNWGILKEVMPSPAIRVERRPGCVLHLCAGTVLHPSLLGKWAKCQAGDHNTALKTRFEPTCPGFRVYMRNPENALTIK